MGTIAAMFKIGEELGEHVLETLQLDHSKFQLHGLCCFREDVENAKVRSVLDTFHQIRRHKVTCTWKGCFPDVPDHKGDVSVPSG